MPDPRRRLGEFGEAAALAFLQRRGLTLVARNWRCRLGEIDIVVRSGEELVFVEVRTRRGAPPAESVGPAKQRRLVALAHTYLEQAGEPPTRPWRIDVVAVTVAPDGRASVEHIPSAIGEA